MIWLVTPSHPFPWRGLPTSTHFPQEGEATATFISGEDQPAPPGTRHIRPNQLLHRVWNLACGIETSFPFSCQGLPLIGREAHFGFAFATWSASASLVKAAEGLARHGGRFSGQVTHLPMNMESFGLTVWPSLGSSCHDRVVTHLLMTFMTLTQWQNAPEMGLGLQDAPHAFNQQPFFWVSPSKQKWARGEGGHAESLCEYTYQLLTIQP